jgi:hypothetical protein
MSEFRRELTPPEKAVRQQHEYAIRRSAYRRLNIKG